MPTPPMAILACHVRHLGAANLPCHPALVRCIVAYISTHGGVLSQMREVTRKAATCGLESKCYEKARCVITSNTRQVLVVHVYYLVAGVDSPLCGCSTPCTGRQRGDSAAQTTTVEDQGRNKAIAAASSSSVRPRARMSGITRANAAAVGSVVRSTASASESARVSSRRWRM